MDDDKYNSQIEKIANMLVKDKINVDEQDLVILKKYRNQTKSDFNLSDEESMKIVYEALLYLKLKNSSAIDPIQKGDQFGAGFS